MEQVLIFDWQQWPLSSGWPRRSWRSLMGLPHFTNWLNCKFMRCPVGIPSLSPHNSSPPQSPFGRHPCQQSVHCWTKTNTTICDQDDAGSLSFLIALRFVFVFIFIFLFRFRFCSRSHSSPSYFYYTSSPCPRLFALATIVMGIMEKIVLHLNNNTRT